MVSKQTEEQEHSVVIHVFKAFRKCRDTHTRIRSSPLPQLLPHLDKSLYLARAGKMIVDEAAIALRNLVEPPDGRQAKMRDAVAKFLEIFLAQHILVPLIWAPRHRGEFYNPLLLFAIQSTTLEASVSRA